MGYVHFVADRENRAASSGKEGPERSQSADNPHGRRNGGGGVEHLHGSCCVVMRDEEHTKKARHENHKKHARDRGL
ncbi:hypothetical protein CULCOIPH002_18620 [Corynebacterium ulcerans]|uniref:Uncharacterized protein n=1 Tax=Corynebacterium ulcerans TaxID=65058 RepID=A0ABD0BK50_CORUL|nr:hypothetical protein CULCOIPH001_12050 [Corynebacterium ulcerans]GJJ36950.1 hypothetical protein CULCOIPH002_18620 [Corynebacterium ulcerans]GJJ37508.1 hypothetical protein CULCOIPH003_01390 [Corynebacterium ulcerans]GJJ43086.1 hypothetical protein CULCOIPH005_12750 [Corynebacterium ulcerans]